MDLEARAGRRRCWPGSTASVRSRGTRRAACAASGTGARRWRWPFFCDLLDVRAELLDELLALPLASQAPLEVVRFLVSFAVDDRVAAHHDRLAPQAPGHLHVAADRVERLLALVVVGAGELVRGHLLAARLQAAGDQRGDLDAGLAARVLEAVHHRRRVGEAESPGAGSPSPRPRRPGPRSSAGACRSTWWRAPGHSGCRAWSRRSRSSVRTEARGPERINRGVHRWVDGAAAPTRTILPLRSGGRRLPRHRFLPREGRENPTDSSPSKENGFRAELSPDDLGADVGN